MNSDPLNLRHAFHSPSLLIDFQLLNRIQHILPLQQPSKHSVLPIQTRLRREGDKELAAIRVRPLIRHAQHAPCIMLQRGTYLVLKGLAVEDGRRGLVFCVGSRRAGLADESLYDAMEGAAIVAARGAEGEEVLGGLGGGFAKDFEFEVTEGGVELLRAD